MQRHQTYTIELLLAVATLLAQPDAMAATSAVAAAASELVYIGTHGTGGGPPSAAPASVGQAQAMESAVQGIYVARLDKKTGHLTALGLGAELQRATWLIGHPTLPVVYSVADSGGGMEANSLIYSYSVDRASGKLQLLNKVDAGGRDATALSLDAPSATLFSANHGSGDVSALPLQADGSLGSMASIQKDYGTGPHPRQKHPQAHGVAVDPTHKYALVADFGADRIFVYHFNGATRALTPAQVPFESLPAGSGPRHLIFHPSGQFLLVDTELTAELRSYRWDPKQGHLHLVQNLAAYPADATGEKSAAEIAFSSDGRFAYLSLRGDQDSIIVYAVNRRSGSLREIQRIPAQGKAPWSFGIDPSGRWLLVTNESSDAVAEFELDPASGKLRATAESLSIPKPVTVVFMR
jgi:6-phosphogluconolactonase